MNSAIYASPEVKHDKKFSGRDAPSFDNGPDQVLPAVGTWTTEKNGRVKLRISGGTGAAAARPISVPGQLQRSAAKYPDRVALMYKGSDGSWINVTYREYEANVRSVAKAFLKLGLKKNHGVGIIGFNSPEWFYSGLGAIYAGGFAVGTYTTNSPEACHHCLETSEANICVVEDDKQLQKILSVRNRLPELRAIVQYMGTPTTPGVLSWSQLIELGNKQDDTELEAAFKKIAVNECCSLIFTSGTVGKPKAVMLSHDNLTWIAYAFCKSVQLKEEDENIVVSYLPLSHIAGQMFDIFFPISVAGKVAFADADALKGSLVKTLADVRPTAFLGVPRVFEKIHDKMLSIGADASGLKKMIATWAKACCLEHHLSVWNGQNYEGYRYKFYRWLVFNRVKTALGLDRAKYCFSGAAPISEELRKYFLSMDIIINNIFGMSETTGPHSVSKPEDGELDTAGCHVCGVETKIDNPTADGQGELCVRGRHIMMGYLKEPDKTKETLDSDGWLHTGDVATLDHRNQLRITGRIKELLITAGGENIPPVPIEDLVKNELPVISNAQLIGDKRKFLTILLTLKTEMNTETGAPLDELVPVVKTWCKDLGCPVNTVTEVLQGPKKEIMEAIQAGIDRANTYAVSNAQRIQKFALLPADFSLPTGELGPTLKLKRSAVYEKYVDIIESLYK